MDDTKYLACLRDGSVFSWSDRDGNLPGGSAETAKAPKKVDKLEVFEIDLAFDFKC